MYKRQAQALADDLGRFLRGEPIRARPVGALGQLKRWCARKPGWTTAGVLGVFLLATWWVRLDPGSDGSSGSRRATRADASASLAVPVALRQATATYSQPGFPIGAAIDGDASGGGWAILESTGAADPTRPQIAVFETETDVGFPGGSLFTFRLIQDGGTQHTLGRFRLAVTTDDRSAFADGRESGGEVGARWTILAPISLGSLGESTLSRLEDSSVVANSPWARADTYTVTAPTSLTGITGIRLEVLPYSVLPVGGPGLNPADGNFILTEFEVEISAASAIRGAISPDLEQGEPLPQAFKFLDPDFEEGSWDMVVFAEPSSVRATQARVTEGPTPAHTWLRTTHVLGGVAQSSEVLSILLHRQVTYDPAVRGGLALADFALDVRVFSTEFNTFGGSTAPALRQGGQVYVAKLAFKPARDDQANPRLPSRWKELRFSGLRDTDFQRVTGAQTLDATRHPDFSERGASIEFGFAHRNTHTFSNQVVRRIDVDNWSVTVYGRALASPP